MARMFWTCGFCLAGWKIDGQTTSTDSLHGLLSILIVRLWSWILSCQVLKCCCCSCINSWRHWNNTPLWGTILDSMMNCTKEIRLDWFWIISIDCGFKERLLDCFGYCLLRCPSTLSGAGSGVKLVKGRITKGRWGQTFLTLQNFVKRCAILPNSVWPASTLALCTNLISQSYCSLLATGGAIFVSWCSDWICSDSRFIFRCKDGVHIDGSHTGVSRIIYSSCVGRDQVIWNAWSSINTEINFKVGLSKIADTSWLTNRPVNPLNIGQFVNNGGKEACNVAYMELDLPDQFPLSLRKFLPNVHFESSAMDGVRPLRLVVLIAVRDIEEGEELLSSYFTILQST